MNNKFNNQNNRSNEKSNTDKDDVVIQGLNIRTIGNQKDWENSFNDTKNDNDNI